MNFTQLRNFVRIAETGSFRKAAGELNVAQPALSRQIQALEHDLGVELFDRHPGGVTLTDAGRRLQERATKILEEVAATRAEIGTRFRRTVSRVSFGTCHSIGSLIFSGLAEKFKRDHPEIELTLVEEPATRLLEGVTNGRLDLALMIGVEPAPEILLEPVIEDPLHLIAAPGARIRRARTLAVADIADLPLISYRRPSGPRMVLEREAARHGLVVRIEQEADSLDVIKGYVARGLGYGVLPRSSVDEDIRSGAFNVTTIRAANAVRYLVRRAGKTADPGIDVVAGEIRAEIDALRRSGLFGRTATAEPEVRRLAG